MKNPFCEDGAKQVPRLKVGLKGPTFLETVDAMRSHAIGKQLLKEKADISRVFTIEYLSTMPVGSFGEAYYDMLNSQDDILPGFMLGGLGYRDGFYDALNVDEDIKWFLERQMFVHDASHIISGYGTDMAGEAINIMFKLGYIGIAKHSMRYLIPLGHNVRRAKTTVSYKKWIETLDIAFERGVKANQHLPFSCVLYEELLSMPLGEVRREHSWDWIISILIPRAGVLVIPMSWRHLNSVSLNC